MLRILVIGQYNCVSILIMICATIKKENSIYIVVNTKSQMGHYKGLELIGILFIAYI